MIANEEGSIVRKRLTKPDTKKLKQKPKTDIPAMTKMPKMPEMPAKAKRRDS